MSNVGQYLSEMADKNREAFYEFVQHKEDVEIIVNVVRLVSVFMLTVWLMNKLYKCCNDPAVEQLREELKECEEKLEETENTVVELEEELSEVKEELEKVKSAFEKHKERYVSCKNAAQRFIDTHAE